jgi:hypothetical protein
MQRRWIGALAAAFLAVVGLTLALRGWRAGSGAGPGVAGGAVVSRGLGGPAGEWIWLAHDRRQPQPLAFYVARDFDLDVPPPRARLLALGDPEYVLYLNGKRVGAGGWRPGARLDQYEAGPLLRPGGNRLLAELRSPDGAGGFLASLVDTASGRALVSTDGTWRAFQRHRLGLLRGWLPVDLWTRPPGGAPEGAAAARGAPSPGSAGSFWKPGSAGSAASAGSPGVAGAAGAATAAGAAAVPGETAFSWGRPPIGRWGRVAPGWPRPLFSELTADRRPLPAASEFPYAPPPETRLAADGSMVLFDWGREVTGYLALEPGHEPEMDPDLAQPPPDRQRTALLWTGDVPPRPAGAGAAPAGPDGAVVLPASARQWLDARLRRFRYALVIGIERPLAARVYEIDPGVAARYGMEIAGAEPGAATAGALPGARGVFGLAAPPRLRTPVEDEVRRKLKSLQGVAGRKGL